MQFDQLKRREFITPVGGAASWPLAVRAQQGDGVRRVGALSTLAESDLEVQSWIRELVQRLQELGWTNGRNVQVDFRFSDAEKWPEAQAEQVARRTRLQLTGKGRNHLPRRGSFSLGRR